jgi:hypothetical protein
VFGNGSGNSVEKRDRHALEKLAHAHSELAEALAFEIAIYEREGVSAGYEIGEYWDKHTQIRSPPRSDLPRASKGQGARGKAWR